MRVRVCLYPFRITLKHCINFKTYTLCYTANVAQRGVLWVRIASCQNLKLLGLHTEKNDVPPSTTSLYPSPPSTFISMSNKHTHNRNTNSKSQHTFVICPSKCSMRCQQQVCTATCTKSMCVWRAFHALPIMRYVVHVHDSHMLHVFFVGRYMKLNPTMHSHRLQRTTIQKHSIPKTTIAHQACTCLTHAQQRRSAIKIALKIESPRHVCVSYVCRFCLRQVSPQKPMLQSYG